MPLALQIDPDGRVATITLPDDRITRDRSITTRLSGPPEPTYYHRRAVMHVHDNGQRERFLGNLVATALACVWRGLDITYDASYFLPGRVVITSPDGTSDLAEDLVDDARAVEAAVRLLLSQGPAPWGDVLRAAHGARTSSGRRDSA